MAMSELHNFDIGTRQAFHIKSKARKSDRTESKKKNLEKRELGWEEDMFMVMLS